MKDSSHVKDANYDPGSQRLTVVFQTGTGQRHYEWDNVPQTYHDSLHSAPSPGQFVHQQLRPRFGDGRLVKIVNE